MGQITLTDALEMVRQTLKEVYGEDSIEYAISLLKVNEIAAIRAQLEEQERQQAEYVQFPHTENLPAFFGGVPGQGSGRQQ